MLKTVDLLLLVYLFVKIDNYTESNCVMLYYQDMLNILYRNHEFQYFHEDFQVVLYSKEKILFNIILSAPGKFS